MDGRARTFEALANAVRLRIVELLAERERTAGELASAFEISRPAVSRHLRLLREAGVVRWRGDAQRRVYRLEAEAVADVADWAETLRARWRSALDRLEVHLDAPAAVGSPGKKRSGP